MDVLTLLVQLISKTVFMAVPFGVAWLAFRRLALSETSNAWIYAGVGLFAAFTAAGLAPWALGAGPVGWFYFVFAAFCPLIWVSVVVVCGIGRPPAYDAPQDETTEDKIAPLRLTTPTSPPLILESPEWPDAPEPTFRHYDAILSPANENLPMIDADSETEAKANRDKSLLEIARDMRGNATSAGRRLRPLLPAPDAMSDLQKFPFLKRTS